MDKLCDRKARQEFHVNIDGAFEHLSDLGDGIMVILQRYNK